MSISVLNTDAALTGKTLDILESAQTITGAKTFDLDPSAPFIVTSGSAVVANLDADKLDGLDSLAFVKADGTVAMTGALVMTSGQVSFPATQVPSAGANVLDDYEEANTWTPTDASGAALSLTVNCASYIKVGQMVFASASVTYPATADGSSAKIGGLPFTASTLGTMFSCTLGDKTETTLVQMRINTNTTNMNLQSATSTAVTNATMSGDTVTFTAIYRATA